MIDLIYEIADVTNTLVHAKKNHRKYLLNSEREKMEDKYFAYDPENNDFLTYPTEEEAKKAAIDILGEYRDEFLPDGWSEGTSGICYGRITHSAKEKIISPQKPPCGAGISCKDCSKGENSKIINIINICKNYDSENDGKAYIEYTFEKK